MNKEKLKAYMVSMAKNDVTENVIKYENYLQDQDIDENATKDPDDYSHREAGGEITDGIDRQIHENKDTMTDIAEVDFGPKSVVEPGAVISISGKNIVVATATEPFEYDGQKYLGISVEAPIYPHIEGLKSGDTFSFQDKEYSIEALH